MLNEIIKNNNLSCTNEEFTEYMNSVEEIEVTTSCIRYTFDTPYNGVSIENNTWDDSAYYYLLNILTKEWYMTYLQSSVPFVSWFVAITNNNFDEVSQGHVADITKNIQNWHKFSKTIEHFK